MSHVLKHFSEFGRLKKRKGKDEGFERERDLNGGFLPRTPYQTVELSKEASVIPSGQVLEEKIDCKKGCWVLASSFKCIY